MGKDSGESAMKKKTMTELNRISVEQFHETEKIPVVVVLDNVRSEMNVGSIFRTADAFLVEKICLCGITAVPSSAEMHKTALGAENSVAWEHYASGVDAVDALRQAGYVVCAVEQVHGSVSLDRFRVKPGEKYALVFGHEVKGVSQEVVDHSNLCIEIPQSGTKHSLNVANSAAILLWDLYRQLL